MSVKDYTEETQTRLSYVEGTKIIFAVTNV